MGKYNKSGRKPPGPKKPPLTHFLCLPLVTEVSRPQLEQSLHSFREQHTVQSSASDAIPSLREAHHGQQAEVESTPYIHPKALRPVDALHCTLGVMSLNDERLAEAKSFLESLNIHSLLSGKSNDQEKAVAPSESTSVESAAVPPITIELRGLESMHPPQKTSILYSTPSDPSERLYAFCLAVQRLFKEKGFLIDDQRDLKLHATIVNTIYAKGKKQPLARASAQASASTHASHDAGNATVGPDVPEASDSRSQGHGPNANAPLKMNARGLLQQYKEHVWAQGVTLEKLAICEMGAKKFTDEKGKIINEQYTEVASVALPTS